jgi:hypothetical protein
MNLMRFTRLAPVGLGLTLALAACGGGNDNPVAGGAAQTATTSVTTATTAAASSGSSTPTASTVVTPTTAGTATLKANANGASQSDIQLALNAAGVPNPANWAREVVEYRPYPTDDPNLTKLRQNLAKYNPGPGVVDKIVSALSL